MLEKIFIQSADGVKPLYVQKIPLCPQCARSGNDSAVLERSKSYGNDGEHHGDSAELVIRCRYPDCCHFYIAHFFLSPNDDWERDGYELMSTDPPQPFPMVLNILHRVELPDLIMDDLKEAIKCLENRLYQAFGAMARRTMHSICADKGAFGQDLKEQIESLTGTVFTSDIAERAQEIRTLGRHGAHPEWEPVDEDLSKTCLENLLWIIEIIYHLPAPTQPQLRVTGKKRYSVPKSSLHKKP